MWTLAQLRKSGLNIVSKCCVYKEKEEIDNHIFIHLSVHFVVIDQCM